MVKEGREAPSLRTAGSDANPCRAVKLAPSVITNVEFRQILGFMAGTTWSTRETSVCIDVCSTVAAISRASTINIDSRSRDDAQALSFPTGEADAPSSLQRPAVLSQGTMYVQLHGRQQAPEALLLDGIIMAD